MTRRTNARLAGSMFLLYIATAFPQMVLFSSASSFALGSTIFAWLFLRARSIPTWLAWVGVVGSLLILIGLPLQIAGFIRSPVTDLMWIPVAVFEIVLGFWLLITGAPEPSRA